MIRHRLTPAFVVAAMAVAVPALAGPPLLCHPYQIGTARSLPWNGASAWTQPSPDYDLKNLVADTEALLTPSTPVIVRMETLRRASLYASGDPQVANQLLSRLMTRAEMAEKKGRPDALALMDAAYVVEAYREITMLTKTPPYSERIASVRAALGDANAYELITKSIAARPDDPALQFAAALITASDNRTAYAEHAAKARAGAAKDPLLAKNLDHIS